MPKDKRKYPNGFYLIDNRILMFGLKPIELAVYNCLCRHGNDNYLSHLRMSTIARESGCAVSSARLAVHSLEMKNLISISPDFKDAPNGGKWHGANYYRILELPDYVRHDTVAGTASDSASNNTKYNNYKDIPPEEQLPL